MSEGNIFISYRRQDAPGHAGRIYDRLNARFPGRVFMDVTDIGPGTMFYVEIKKQLGSCRAFIALIGDEWLTSTDRAGKRRLDDPDDFVRNEVAAALLREIMIIPVLVNGATMPEKAALPEDIAGLTSYNALEITQANFEHGVERLIRVLEKILAPLRWHRRLLVWLKGRLAWLRGRLAWQIGLGVVGLFAAGAIGWFVLWPIVTHMLSGYGNNIPINRNYPSPTPKETVTPDNRFKPPVHVAQFINSRDGLAGKLAEHYVDFNFYYPITWVPDSTARKPGSTNFAKVDRILGPDLTQELTQENFAVGWYSSEDSTSEFSHLVETLSAQFARNFPEYQKVSEGPTKVNSLDGYEFRFESMSRRTAHGDIRIWGRAIFLPHPNEGKKGVTLVMLATSLAPEIRSENDVGIKGETPMILKSFRFGAAR